MVRSSPTVLVTVPSATCTVRSNQPKFIKDPEPIPKEEPLVWSLQPYEEKEHPQKRDATKATRCPHKLDLQDHHINHHEVLPHYHHSISITTIAIAILLPCNLDLIAIGNIVRTINLFNPSTIFASMFSIADMIAMCE